MVEPMGAGAAVTVSGVAGAPRLIRVGVGTHAVIATPTQAATAVAAPPTARLARGDRRKGRAYRSGFSMKRSVSTASPPEARTAVNLPASPSGWPSNSGVSTRNGQCHRYQEYDSRPIA